MTDATNASVTGLLQKDTKLGQSGCDAGLPQSLIDTPPIGMRPRLLSTLRRGGRVSSSTAVAGTTRVLGSSDLGSTTVGAPARRYCRLGAFSSASCEHTLLPWHFRWVATVLRESDVANWCVLRAIPPLPRCAS